MKKIFGITLALVAAFAIVYLAFKPESETAAVNETGAEAAGAQAAVVNAVGPQHEPAAFSSTLEDVSAASAPALGGGAPTARSQPSENAPSASVESPTWLDYFKEGQGSYSNGDYGDACRAFERALEENEDNFYLHYMLGLSYWKNGRHERAAEGFNRCLELQPTFVKGWVNLARVRRELEDPQEAIALCEKALTMDEGSDDAWNVMGLSYLDTGTREKAIECFTKAIAVNDGNAYALNNLGLAYIYEERYEDALLPLEQAVELAPGVPFIHNNLGVVYEHLGRTAEAARQYAEAVELPAGHSKAEASLKRILPLLSVEEEARLAEFYQVIER